MIYRLFKHEFDGKGVGIYGVWRAIYWLGIKEYIRFCINRKTLANELDVYWAKNGGW